MGGPVFPLNLPNVLTVLRIMLVPVVVVALLGNTPAGDVLAAVVFALASLTDFVDGRLARRVTESTRPHAWGVPCRPRRVLGRAS